MQLTRKSLSILFNLFLAITCIFFIIRLTPGDPVVKILGPNATGEEIEAIRIQLGLNKSLGLQYFDYLKNILSGDFGTSLYSKKTVVSLLKERAFPSFIIALLSISFSFIIGTSIGVFSALKKSSRSDYLFRFVTLLALSFPIFSLAPLLVLIFSIKLGVLPVSEWLSWRHVVLPVTVLVIPLSSVLSRVARSRFLEETNSPWVRVLHAKGMSELSIVLRLVKISMPTILNVLAIQLTVVITGTIITESIFDIPGVGLLLFEGIQNRDYPVVQGIIIYSTLLYLGIYYLFDILISKIDPRIDS